MKVKSKLLLSLENDRDITTNQHDFCFYNMIMIITLGGKCGAGKGTLAKKLAEHLGYSIIGIGDIKRDLAQQQGMTILERDQIGRNNPEKAKEHDLQFEAYQKSLDINEHIILDGRMAFRCQPDGYNIFLDVSDEQAAERIFADKRIHDANESYEHVLQTNTTRNIGHQETYLKLYNVDLFDMKHYDLVIDTSDKTPDEVFQLCLVGFQERSA